MKHINIGRVAAENECYDGHDENLDCKVLDEDKILNCIESDMVKGKTSSNKAILMELRFVIQILYNLNIL